MSALVAPSLEAAHAVKDVAQGALDISGTTASLSGDLLRPVTNAVETGLDLTSASIELGTSDRRAAEALSARVYAELSDLALRDPAILRPVQSILLPVAAMHDHERRGVRFKLAYEIASLLESELIDIDVSSLGTLVVRARKELSEQHARLTAELTVGQSYSVSGAHTLMDVYSKLAEGPLRRLGSFLKAVESSATASGLRLQSSDILEPLPYGEVIRYLGQKESILVSGVDQLNRNAEAHHDYQIFGESVEIRHLYRGTAQTKSLTIDDVVAEVANIGEISLALLLAVVRASWGLSDYQAREVLRRAWLTS